MELDFCCSIVQTSAERFGLCYLSGKEAIVGCCSRSEIGRGLSPDRWRSVEEGPLERITIKIRKTGGQSHNRLRKRQAAGQNLQTRVELFKCQPTSKTAPLPTPKTAPPPARSGALFPEWFRLGSAGGASACSWFPCLVALVVVCPLMPVELFRLFSPQASLVGVGGGSPPMPTEEEPPACGRNNPDLRFSLSR